MTARRTYALMIKPPNKWEDKTVALLLLAVVAALAYIGWWAWHREPSSGDIPNEDVIDLALKAAGGIVVLLGSYFAARTLNQNRRDTRLNQLLKAAEMLASESPAVQTAGRETLKGLADPSNSGITLEQHRAIANAVLCAAPRDRDT